MAPSKIEDTTEIGNHNAELAGVQARAAAKQAVMHGSAEPPPVADDYMYDFKYNHALPTTDALGIEFPKDCDAQVEADGIVKRLSDALGSSDAGAFTEIFLEYGNTAPGTLLSENL